MNKGKSTTTSGMEWNTMLGLSERLKKDGLYRDYLLIIVGCYFGLRIGDLLNLKWNDLLDAQEIIVLEGKTKKKRRITLNQSVINALIFCSEKQKEKHAFRIERYIFANRWGGKITVSYINKRLKFIFKKYNVKVANASSHTLRKTFGKRIYEMDNKSERSLIYLSEIFSHSNIAITRKYIGITQEQISDLYINL